MIKLMITPWMLLSLFSSSGFAAEPVKTKMPVQASKKLEFDDQSINALDPDYGKLDLSSIRDENSLEGRMYPIRKEYRKEQNQLIRFWGVGE